MAMLPSGYVVSTTGVYTSFPAERIGAVVYGLTSATTTTGKRAGALQTLPIQSGVPSIPSATRKTRPIAVSGTNHTYSAQKAYTAGTFYYDGGRSQMLINRYSTKINNVASTLLSVTGGDAFRQRRNIKNKDRGSSYGAAIRAGYFSFTKVSGSRRPWTNASYPAALTNSFQSTTSGSNSDDQAMYVTWRTVPGELQYLHGSGLGVKLADYPAHNG